jgi:hypothetical protein
MIIVYVDGRCRPGGSDPTTLPTSGDGCEEGGFYTDSPSGRLKSETMLLELMDEVDRRWRTRAPDEQPAP